MFVKMELSTVLISLVVVVIILIAMYYFYFKNKIDDVEIKVEEGKFFYFNQDKWKYSPLLAKSNNTLLGSIIFDDERYDPEQDSITKLYCGKSINKQQAWVIKGMSSKVVKYWSYGLYKVNNFSLVPIGQTLNNRMVKDSRNGDDVVVIISPNYKFAQYIANLIVKKEYNKKLPDDRHVIFRYFPMPNFDASLKYTMLFESYKNNAGANPKIKAYRYTFTKEEEFPFYPVEDKQSKSMSNSIIDENKLVEAFDEQLERQVGKYKNKKINSISVDTNKDYLHTTSNIYKVKEGDKFIVGVMDHSSTGKCLYSEIMFMDPVSGIPYKTHLVSEYDATNVDSSGKIKTFIHTVPLGINQLIIVEKIVIDMITDTAPYRENIVPARVYLL